MRQKIKATKTPSKPLDTVFFATVASFVIFGIIMLSSASGPSAYSKFGDAFWFVKHQILYGILPGAFLLYVLSRVDYHVFRRLSTPMLGFVLLCLVVVFIPGIRADWGTSRSWIDVFGFSFQPVEVAKLAFVLFLAGWLDKIGDEGAKDFHRGLLPFVICVATVCGLLVLQPDLGSVSIVVGTAILMFFLGGARLGHLGLVVAAGSVAFAALMKAAPYRVNRLTTFLHPELDPRGIGYHINQALLAIGSGGFFGLGFGHSRQKFQYLPEVEGDSIFAVMGEELGFVLVAIFVAGVAFLAMRGFRIAKHAPDRYGRLVAGGIVAWITLQSFVNMAGMLSLMPLTGLTLPFVSYGGSSLLVTLAAVGIVLSVSRQQAGSTGRAARR